MCSFLLAFFSLLLVFTTCVCLSIHLNMDGLTESRVQAVNVTFDIG